MNQHTCTNLRTHADESFTSQTDAIRFLQGVDDPHNWFYTRHVKREGHGYRMTQIDALDLLEGRDVADDWFGEGDVVYERLDSIVD